MPSKPPWKQLLLLDWYRTALVETCSSQNQSCLTYPSWWGQPLECKTARIHTYPFSSPYWTQQWGEGPGWMKLSWVAVVLKLSSLDSWDSGIVDIGNKKWTCLIISLNHSRQGIVLQSFAFGVSFGISCRFVYRQECFSHICLRALVHVTFLFLIMLTNCLAFDFYISLS